MALALGPSKSFAYGPMNPPTRTGEWPMACSCGGQSAVGAGGSALQLVGAASGVGTPETPGTGVGALSGAAGVGGSAAETVSTGRRATTVAVALGDRVTLPTR